MLEDFQTGTASMARKRHLASTARGFLCFCLMTHRTFPSYPSNPWQDYPAGQVFIFVYRLAMDARPWRGDDVAD